MSYMGQGPQGSGGVKVTVYGPGSTLPPDIARQVQFANHLVQVAARFQAHAPALQPQPNGFPARGLTDYGLRPVSPQPNLYINPVSYQPSGYSTYYQGSARPASNHGTPQPSPAVKQSASSPEKPDLLQVSGEQKYPEATFPRTNADDVYGTASPGGDIYASVGGDTGDSVKLESTPGRAKQIALWFKGLISRKTKSEASSVSGSHELAQTPKRQEKIYTESLPATGTEKNTEPEEYSFDNPIYEAVDKLETTKSQKKKGPPRPPPPYQPKDKKATQQGQTEVKQARRPGTDPLPEIPASAKERLQSQDIVPVSEGIYESIDIENDYEVIHSEPLLKPSKGLEKIMKKGAKTVGKFEEKFQKYEESLQKYINKGSELRGIFKGSHATRAQRQEVRRKGYAAFNEYQQLRQEVHSSHKELLKLRKDVERLQGKITGEIAKQGPVDLPVNYKEFMENNSRFLQYEVALQGHLLDVQMTEPLTAGVGISLSDNVRAMDKAAISLSASNKRLSAAFELAKGN